MNVLYDSRVDIHGNPVEEVEQDFKKSRVSNLHNIFINTSLASKCIILQQWSQNVSFSFFLAFYFKR